MFNNSDDFVIVIVPIGRGYELWKLYDTGTKMLVERASSTNEALAVSRPHFGAEEIEMCYIPTQFGAARRSS